MAKTRTTKIVLPEVSLVVLIGASGSGKSTCAKTHFLPTEVLSSDFFRALVSDDENSLDATDDAFAALHFVAARRLANMKLTVVDATNVQAFARKPLVQLARQHHVFPIALVLDIPEQVCRQRNRQRSDRNFGDHVIGQQCKQLRHSLKNLKREGFRRIHVLRSEEEVGQLTIERERLWSNCRDECGPFDIIGDVHGCADELRLLLSKLGYEVAGDRVTPPAGRKAIFLGDLVDRGPKIPEALRLVMGMVADGTARCVPGNHDVRLMKALQGKNVQRTHGLLESLEQLDAQPAEFGVRVSAFIDGLVSHCVLDGGELVVAHAGMKSELAGRTSATVREFALYGEATGETDEFGLPVRWDWAAEYRGQAAVIYGHTPVPHAAWLNNTVNIDTGCVFGGSLTALRYPERELVSVAAARAYAEPVRPIAEPDETPGPSAQQAHDDVLDIGDLLGKRIVDTRLLPAITIREDRGIAALEVISRFAIDPRWLLYLPPTMSPTRTSARPDLLEHPAEAFAYYGRSGAGQVICQEKHMGSRATVLICRDGEAAARRLGVAGDDPGVCYTRTGRRFFDDDELESQFLERIRMAVSSAGLWEELETTWMLLDCELMPWSARAQQLLKEQYAAVGAAARISLGEVVAALETATARDKGSDSWLDEYRARRERIERYIDAYRAYCWPVAALTDLKLAPFHLMASEGTVHCDKTHLWHLEMLAKLCAADPEIFQPTGYRLVDLDEEDSRTEATTWWEERTESGSEGMVVKPLTFVARGGRGELLQPAVKCRGREYLRIIYGPEYTTPEHLQQLRRRNVKAKQSLALREFSLGLEALERFVRGEPLRRVHECVFGVLALESEPVDPRL